MMTFCKECKRLSDFYFDEYIFNAMVVSGRNGFDFCLEKSKPKIKGKCKCGIKKQNIINQLFKEAQTTENAVIKECKKSEKNYKKKHGKTINEDLNNKIR